MLEKSKLPRQIEVIETESPTRTFQKLPTFDYANYHKRKNDQPKTQYRIKRYHRMKQCHSSAYTRIAKTSHNVFVKIPVVFFFLFLIRRVKMDELIIGMDNTM